MGIAAQCCSPAPIALWLAALAAAAERRRRHPPLLAPQQAPALQATHQTTLQWMRDASSVCHPKQLTARECSGKRSHSSTKFLVTVSWTVFMHKNMQQQGSCSTSLQAHLCPPAGAPPPAAAPRPRPARALIALGPRPPPPAAALTTQ